MKRFGEKATREAIANGAIIRAWDWYTLNAGYRVIIDGEQAGYITGDLFVKLKNDGAIIKDIWAHSYTDYKAPATQDATDDQAADENGAEAEKTAQEWAAESDRVQAATLAALAPVIATEEAEEAQEQQETAQEKTDRENWEHCRRIAEELEAYADGRVYRCPECGACITDENLFCDCGAQVDLISGEWEQLSLYDYFSDCLDIEYRCGSDKEYRSVSIMVACGGPNIYIDTAEKAVLLYWWTDRARHYLSSDAVDAVNDWAEEYWNCL